jgi:hypothetical protein
MSLILENASDAPLWFVFPHTLSRPMEPNTKVTVINVEGSRHRKETKFVWCSTDFTPNKVILCVKPRSRLVLRQFGGCSMRNESGMKLALTMSVLVTDRIMIDGIPLESHFQDFKFAGSGRVMLEYPDILATRLYPPEGGRVAFGDYVREECFRLLPTGSFHDEKSIPFSVGVPDPP